MGLQNSPECEEYSDRAKMSNLMIRGLGMSYENPQRDIMCDGTVCINGHNSNNLSKIGQSV